MHFHNFQPINLIYEITKKWTRHLIRTGISRHLKDSAVNFQKQNSMTKQLKNEKLLYLENWNQIQTNSRAKNQKEVICEHNMTKQWHLYSRTITWNTSTQSTSQTSHVYKLSSVMWHYILILNPQDFASYMGLCNTLHNSTK